MQENEGEANVTSGTHGPDRETLVAWCLQCCVSVYILQLVSIYNLCIVLCAQNGACSGNEHTTSRARGSDGGCILVRHRRVLVDLWRRSGGTVENECF